MADYGSFQWCFLVKMALALNLSPVETIVAHDPQKLLPDLRGTPQHHSATWDILFLNRWNDPDATPLDDIKRWMDSIYPSKSLGVTVTAAAFRGLDLDDEYIDFETASPTARHIDFRKLHPPRTLTLKHKMVVIPVYPDFETIERQILASIDDPSLRCLLLDIDNPDGEVRPRNRQMELYALGAMLDKPKAVATSAGKRDMSYLDHDPTKKHRRRK